MSHSHSHSHSHSKHNKVKQNHIKDIYNNGHHVHVELGTVRTSPHYRAYVNGVYYPLHSIKESKGEV